MFFSFKIVSFFLPPLYNQNWSKSVGWFQQNVLTPSNSILGLGRLRWGDVLFTFLLFFSHYLSCSLATQEFGAVLGLAESNLINSSSQQGSSSRQELLVSTTLLHSFFLALGPSQGFLSSLWQPLQWCLSGEPHTKSGAPNHLSHPLPADECARGDIKAKVRWEEPDPLTYLSWILSLSRLTHHWVCSIPRLPFPRVRNPSPLTTSMQEIWASLFSLGRFIAAERFFKQRGWPKKKCTVGNGGTWDLPLQVWARFGGYLMNAIPGAMSTGSREGIWGNWACCRADTPTYSACQQSCFSGGDPTAPFPPLFPPKSEVTFSHFL